MGINIEEQQNNSVPNKDLSIELTRIVACFFVICIHLDLGFTTGDVISKGGIFLACLRADAVAMFWLIAGMHFFRERTYESVLKSMIKRVVLPALALTCVLFYFSDWIMGNQTLHDSVNYSSSEYAALIKSLFLEWKPSVPYTGHLWYVFIYILLCFLQPIGAAFVNYINTYKRQMVFCLISFFALVLNDISQNQFGNFSHHTFGGAVPAMVIMIWGKLLYDKRETVKKMNVILLLGAFLGINLLRCFLLLFVLVHKGNGSQHILYWYTSFGLVCSILMYLFCLALSDRIKTVGIAAKGIEIVGGMTFSIYLIHVFVEGVLIQKGLSNTILNTVSRFRYVLINHGLYYLVFGSIVFIICLGIGAGIHIGKAGIIGLVSKIR